MASTDSNKTSDTKTTAKPGRTNGRSSTAARSAANGGKPRRTAASNGRRRNADNTAPYLTTAVASLVGVGVALGVGLFATRRRWMPYAEGWNEYLRERWDHYADAADQMNDDHSDFQAIDDADADMPESQEAASATFPGDSPRANA